MTSRALFFKLSREELKHKIWLAALLVLLLFCAMPLSAALNAGQGLFSATGNDVEVLQLRRVEIVLRAFSRDGFLIAITIIAGSITGIAMFAYLFSRKKIDLVHSLPVKRSTLFLVKYLNGLFLYIGAVVVNFVILLLVAASFGIFTGSLLSGVLQLLAEHLLGFILMYTFAALGAVLCGNLVVGGLVTLLLVLLPNMLAGIIDIYSERFYQTYVHLDSLAEQLLEYIAPVQRYVKVLGTTRFVAFLMIPADGTEIVILLLTAVVLIAILAVLFCLRPSEGAGKALAFPKAALPIRILGIIPLTLLIGTGISELAYGTGNGWLIFGLVFGFLLCGCIINMILYFDFRKAFACPRQLVGCALAVAAVYCFFFFDVTGYDNYLPKQEKLAAMGMNISTMALNDGMEAVVDDAGVRFAYGSYISKLEGQNLPPQLAYEFARWMRDNGQRPVQTSGSSAEVNAVPTMVLSAAKESASMETYVLETMNRVAFCTVKYELKSGRTVYREYSIPVNEETKQYIDQLYNAEEYKKSLYPILQADAADVHSAQVEGANLSVQLTEATKERLVPVVAAYQKELRAMTAAQLENSVPVGKIVFRFKYKTGGSVSSSTECYIYPEFTETLALLAAQGIEPGFNPEQIQAVRVYRTNDMTEYEKKMAGGFVDDWYANAEESMDMNLEYSSWTFTEQEQITQLLPAMMPQQYHGNNILEPQTSFLYMAQIIYKPDAYGNQTIVDCALVLDKIPEFVYAK